MSNFPNSFLEAGVIPNHIRMTNVDTTQLYIYDNIPHSLITFTQSSTNHIGSVTDYDKLESIASGLLETTRGDIQIVIDVTGKNEKGGLLGEIHIYKQFKEFGTISRLDKSISIDISESINSTSEIVEITQKRNTEILP
ncbi:hypothetical protein K2X92_00235 [Candidatus Gracilibacteria bacterium]|nr:hypothetical protein [Candidatus Gracilibacteria bacterium]